MKPFSIKNLFFKVFQNLHVFLKCTYTSASASAQTYLWFSSATFLPAVSISLSLMSASEWFWCLHTTFLSEETKWTAVLHMYFSIWWAHRLVNPPMGQTTARYPPEYLTLICHWNVLEPLKDPVTIWSSSCFAKDQVQCFHLAPTASPLLTIPTDLSVTPSKEDTF